MKNVSQKRDNHRRFGLLLSSANADALGDRLLQMDESDLNRLYGQGLLDCLQHFK